MLKRFLIILVITILTSVSASAQHNLVAKAKKAIDALTLTTDTYTGAMNTLKPALTDDATRNRAETWTLASRIQVELYDKYMDNRRVGKNVDTKAMGHALIDAYQYGMTALKLDTIHVLDNKGKPQIDKKTKLPKVKTKYSKDIINRLVDHHNDYRTAGSDLYNIKDWDGAYQAWDIYCMLAQRTDDKRWQVPDTTIAEVKYYQAIAAWQKGDTLQAVKLFSVARNMGYEHKEAYDYALICLSDLGDEASIVKLAGEAYAKYGTSDPQYIRILINDFINHQQLDSANQLLDEALAANDQDDELYNLKGLVVEHQSNMDDALPYYLHCIELNDSNAQGLFNVGRYYYNQATITRDRSSLVGKRLARLVNPIYSQALPYLEKSYNINPNNEDLKNALRDIYYKLGEADKLQRIESNR